MNDERFFQRVLSEGNLGGGESYVDGWWDVESLDEFFTRVQRAELYKNVGGLGIWWIALSSWLFNRQTKSRSERVAQEHYDLGNDIYEAMLDRNMRTPARIGKGRRHWTKRKRTKLRLISRKLQIAPGMTVLDVGGGFGGLARSSRRNMDDGW